jgi:hypothetical protein
MLRILYTADTITFEVNNKENVPSSPTYFMHGLWFKQLLNPYVTSILCLQASASEHIYKGICTARATVTTNKTITRSFHVTEVSKAFSTVSGFQSLITIHFKS